MADAARKVDVPALMAEIRARVKERLAGSREKPAPFRGRDSGAVGKGRESDAAAIVHAEELQYLNRNYLFARSIPLDHISSHRGGIIGRAITSLKRRLLVMLKDQLLKPYLDAEAEFHINTVRVINKITRHLAERDTAIFWELIHKIDTDVARVLQRVEEVADEGHAARAEMGREVSEAIGESLRSLQTQVGSLAEKVHAHGALLATVDGVARGMEGIVAKASRGPSALPDLTTLGDQSYVLFEHRFRGSSEVIRERLTVYPELFAATPHAELPVLDFGAGRGELLELLSQRGVTSYGVDSDSGMVDDALRRGLEVRREDGFSHLATLPDHSLRGVIAIQVVEHLPFPLIQKFLELAARKVVAGGLVIMETINPRSMVALSSNYFRDPTHKAPLHPDTLAYECTLQGFKVREVRYLSPVPVEAQLKKIEVEPFMTPRWALFVERMNHNIDQINGILFGHQDYAVIAEVR